MKDLRDLKDFDDTSTFLPTTAIATAPSGPVLRWYLRAPGVDGSHATVAPCVRASSSKPFGVKGVG